MTHNMQIKDSVYWKLTDLKDNEHRSFSEVLEMLLSEYDEEDDEEDEENEEF